MAVFRHFGETVGAMAFRGSVSMDERKHRRMEMARRLVKEPSDPPPVCPMCKEWQELGADGIRRLLLENEHLRRCISSVFEQLEASRLFSSANLEKMKSDLHLEVRFFTKHGDADEEEGSSFPRRSSMSHLSGATTTSSSQVASLQAEVKRLQALLQRRGQDALPQTATDNGGNTQLGSESLTLSQRPRIFTQRKETACQTDEPLPSLPGARDPTRSVPASGFRARPNSAGSNGSSAGYSHNTSRLGSPGAVHRGSTEAGTRRSKRGKPKESVNDEVEALQRALAEARAALAAQAANPVSRPSGIPAAAEPAQAEQTLADLSAPGSQRKAKLTHKKQQQGAVAAVSEAAESEPSEAPCTVDACVGGGPGQGLADLAIESCGQAAVDAANGNAGARRTRRPSTPLNKEGRAFGWKVREAPALGLGVSNPISQSSSMLPQLLTAKERCAAGRRGSVA